MNQKEFVVSEEFVEFEEEFVEEFYEFEGE